MLKKFLSKILFLVVWATFFECIASSNDSSDGISSPPKKRTYKYIPDSATHCKSHDFLRSTYGAQHITYHHPLIKDIMSEANSSASGPLKLGSPSINLSTTYGTGSLPTTLDMTTGYPPPFNQGQLGSCTANALVGIALYDLISQGKITLTQAATIGNSSSPGGMLSRLYLYWQERNIEGTVSSDSGASLTDGISVLHTKGVCREYLFPYSDATTGPTATFKNTPTAAMDADALNFMNLDINPVNTASVAQNVNTIKALLYANCPLVAGFLVYASFETQTVANTGIVPMPNTSTEAFLGGHALAFAGYDDSKNCFLMRNSWGTNWGTSNVASGVGGYFWMPYSYITSTTLTSAIWKISSAGSAPTVTSYLPGHDWGQATLTRYDTVLLGTAGNFNGLNLTTVSGTTSAIINLVQTGGIIAANNEATTVSFPSSIKSLQFTGDATGMDTICSTIANALPALTSNTSGCVLRFSLTTGPASPCNWFTSALPSNWSVTIDAGSADPMLSVGILDQPISITVGSSNFNIPSPSTVSQINASLSKNSSLSTNPTVTLSGNNTIFAGALSNLTYVNGTHPSTIQKTSTIYGGSLSTGMLTVGSGSTTSALTIKATGAKTIPSITLVSNTASVSIFGN